MLSLEAIGILGFLYIIFTFGVLKAVLANNSQKVEEPDAAARRGATEAVRLNR